MLLHLLQVIKVLEHAVLEYRVEFVLDGGEDGDGLQRIDTLGVEWLSPIEGL